jgi:DNA-binding response OmpR family regulator
MAKTGSDMTSRLSGLKVLVVEDEPVIAMTLEEMLKTIGCSVVWHANGVTEALAMMRDHKPDCAILDLYLAGELAYPIARWLDAARIPFVFAKGYGRRTILGEWASRPVIQKPFSIRALQAKLEAALDQGKAV